MSLTGFLELRQAHLLPTQKDQVLHMVAWCACECSSFLMFCLFVDRTETRQGSPLYLNFCTFLIWMVSFGMHSFCDTLLVWLSVARAVSEHGSPVNTQATATYWCHSCSWWSCSVYMECPANLIVHNYSGVQVLLYPSAHMPQQPSVHGIT